MQQCTGTHPTQGADEGEYLDNSYEREGFQYQVEFIDDHFGKEEAEDYVENLLDHHDIKDDDKKDELKDVLMERI